MFNFNLEGLENLNKFGELDKFKDFGGLIGAIGALALFFIIIICVAIIFLWVFSSIGIMNAAKKKNVSNPWLAFIPVGKSYLVGKLGFEAYVKNDKKNPTLTWITLGLSAAVLILGDDSDGLTRLASIGLLVFESMAFYNIFKAINPKNATLYTVFTVLTDTLLGGLFLYINKTSEEKEKANIVEIKEEKNKEKNKEVHKEVKQEDNKNKFCENCGFKLNKNAKFCPECGKKS